jgi:4-amino-4-deoxy-L-arabinose transferase-like glycosyltransferase
MTVDWRPRSTAALLTAVFAWLGITAWLRSLAVPDEGRYIGVAWEMVRSGDWITPTLNGLPYFHKPPLFYWLTASSLSVFGVNEWAGRIAPWAGACLMAASCLLFGRRWGGERFGRAWTFVLVTLPLVFVSAQYANLDMLVAGCITASILSLAHACLLDPHDRARRRALLVGWAFVALGVLAKGLIGAVIPAMVLGLWLLATRQPMQILRLLWIPGLLLFLLVAAPWFLAMQQRFPEFANYFFVKHHFTRYTQVGFNNAQPAWFFPVVLLVLGLPWTAWLLARKPAVTDAQRSIRWLMWTWLVAVVGFFTMPNSKLVGYILPAVPPLAWLIASGWSSRRDAPGLAGRIARFTLPVAAAICVAAVVAIAWNPYRSARSAAAVIAARPQQPVVFLHHYYFDVPLYARLRQPVVVVDRWDDPKLMQGDNWRRELVEASAFAPEAGRARLLLPEVMQAGPCPGARTWVVGSPDHATRYPVLAGAPRTDAGKQVAVWDVSGWSPRCAGTPTRN